MSVQVFILVVLFFLVQEILLYVWHYSEKNLVYNWNMKHHLYTLMFLILAIALYFVGMALPATVFLVFGMLAEAVFWVRLFRVGRKSDS
jgi:hypothetical protein